MFTASIVRTLNKLHGGSGPVHRPHQLPRKRKSVGGARQESANNESRPVRTDLSEPIQKCLEDAKTKVQLLKTSLQFLKDATHPSDVLRVKTFTQHLRQWSTRIHRLERELARHHDQRTQFLESRETLSGREARLNSNSTLASIPDTSDIEQETVHSNQCLHCGAKSSMRINIDKNTQQCTKCFLGEPCFDVVHTEGDRPMTSKQNHYYPENQWNNALNYAQGMRCGMPAPEIINKVMEVLDHTYKVKREDLPDVKHELIDDILKSLSYKKRSKQKILIWCIITGRTPERMTIEEYVEADKYAQVYFRHVRDVIKELNLLYRLNRKNLLSYDYLAYKIFELISKTHDPSYKRHMNWYKLLQSDDKIWVQDRIWEKVCARAGWQFFPTV